MSHDTFKLIFLIGTILYAQKLLEWMVIILNVFLISVKCQEDIVKVKTIKH